MAASDAGAYTEEQWRESIVGRPLGKLSADEFLTLHRHWCWTMSARERFFEHLRRGERPRVDDMQGNAAFAMYLWYAMLATAIEALTKRRVAFEGALRDDLRQIRESLREARNAVFHVADAYNDDRLFAIMRDPESVGRLRRVDRGLSRLLSEELSARKPSKD